MGHTRKILEINENGQHLICIKDNGAKYNPYRLYTIWWDNGTHRKQIVRYADFESILYRILQLTTGRPI